MWPCRCDCVSFDTSVVGDWRERGRSKDESERDTPAHSAISSTKVELSCPQAKAGLCDIMDLAIAAISSKDAELDT